eukprot:3369281-Prymnesium_polylepis.1
MVVSCRYACARGMFLTTCTDICLRSTGPTRGLPPPGPAASHGRRRSLSRWASLPPRLVDASITLASHTFPPNSIALLWRRELR